MRQLLTIGQRIALDATLSDYPDSSFFRILDLIENDDQNITVSELFSNFHLKNLTNYLIDLSESIDKAIKK